MVDDGAVISGPVQDFDFHPDEDQVRVFTADPGEVLRFSGDVYVSAARYGDCAARSLVVTGPVFRQTDLRFTKRTKVAGRTDFELGVNVLNLFNQANFVPLTQPTNCNCTQGGIGGTNVLSNYELTTLAGTNTSRLAELVVRFNW